jgi:hypothetical protein
MMPKTVWLLLAGCIAAALGTSVANATVLQISATGLVLRTSVGSTDEPGAESKGLLTDTQGRYFAPVVFPTSGENVCSFAVIFRDNDALNITAKLKKKPFTLGTDTAFDPPVTMAQVSSSGGSMNTRRAATTAVTQRLIDTQRAFYYVELDVPEAANIDVLGMQINVKPTC